MLKNSRDWSLSQKECGRKFALTSEKLCTQNLEPAWEKECGAKFGLMQIRLDLPNGGYRLVKRWYGDTGTEYIDTGTSKSAA